MNYKDGFDYRYNVPRGSSPSIAGDDPMLVDKAGYDLGILSALVETTGDAVDRETQAAWCAVFVREILAELGLTLRPAEAGADLPADEQNSSDIPGSSMPQYPHELADLVQPTTYFRVSAGRRRHVPLPLCR